MDRYEQIDAFYGDLTKLIDRYKAEFDIDIFTIVGAMEDKKISLLLDTQVEFGSDIDLDDELDSDDE